MACLCNIFELPFEDEGDLERHRVLFGQRMAVWRITVCSGVAALIIGTAVVLLGVRRDLGSLLLGNCIDSGSNASTSINTRPISPWRDYTPRWCVNPDTGELTR